MYLLNIPPIIFLYIFALSKPKQAIMKSKFFDYLEQNPKKLAAVSKPVWTLLSVNYNGSRLFEFHFEDIKIRFKHLSSVQDFLLSNGFES